MELYRMKNKHLNLLIPQWQGGGLDKSTYFGGIEIRDNYMQGLLFSEVNINTADSFVTRNNIFGYDHIYHQLKQAKDIIEELDPDTILTIGGGCDADVVPIAYLNRRYNHELTFLWFDAHGDLHTPETSESHLFYGMPLRLVLGEGDKDFLALLGSKIGKSQLVMLGTREIDRAEERFVNENSITVLTCADIENNLNDVVKCIGSFGNSKLYLHIDLDVLEPTEFPYVPLPVKDGLKIRVFERLIAELHRDFEIVGLGIYEYNAKAKKKNSVIEKLIIIGNSLGQ